MIGSDVVTDTFFEARPLARLLFKVRGPVVTTGDLLRVRARSRDDSDPDPSFSSVIGSGINFCLCFFDTDLVTGAKYESLASESEGSGDGEMTRGVDGTPY